MASYNDAFITTYSKLTGTSSSLSPEKTRGMTGSLGIKLPTFDMQSYLAQKNSPAHIQATTPSYGSNNYMISGDTDLNLNDDETCEKIIQKIINNKRCLTILKKVLNELETTDTSSTSGSSSSSTSASSSSTSTVEPFSMNISIQIPKFTQQNLINITVIIIILLVAYKLVIKN